MFHRPTKFPLRGFFCEVPVRDRWSLALNLMPITNLMPIDFVLLVSLFARHFRTGLQVLPDGVELSAGVAVQDVCDGGFTAIGSETGHA